MAVSVKFYGPAVKAAFNKEIDFNSDTIKGMLVSSGYTFDQDNHDYKNDITNELANGNGYTTGGKTLTNCTISYDGSTNKLTLGADDVSWPASSLTARGMVVYDDTPALDANKPLIAYVDFGANIQSITGTLTVDLPATGLATVTVA